jgi:cytochrome c-type biogenesis protein CcmE
VTDTLPVDTRRGIRWRYVIVALVCVGAIVWMLVLMQRNVIFFYPVSQAVTKSSHHTTNRIRIGGAVVPQSIKEHGDGVDFELTDNSVTVLVHHTGGEPPLFKDCAPVVAEGHWSAPDSMTFDSTRLLIKHGNDYRAPKDAKGQCPKDPFPREG